METPIVDGQHRLAALRADPIGQLEILEVLARSPEIPCSISKGTPRGEFCGTQADHRATVQVILSCGHVSPYCGAAYEKIAALALSLGEVYGLRAPGLTCHITNEEITIVAVEPL